MNKLPLLIVALVACVLAGCANPSYLTNSYNDIHNHWYASDPAATGFFTNVAPALVLPYFVTLPVDVFFLNPVQFGIDVFHGEGTSFVHDNVVHPKEPWFHEANMRAGETPEAE